MNKRVDGINRINLEKIAKSREIVLNSIEEELKKKRAQEKKSSIFKKVDGIFYREKEKTEEPVNYVEETTPYESTQPEPIQKSQETNQENNAVKNNEIKKAEVVVKKIIEPEIKVDKDKQKIWQEEMGEENIDLEDENKKNAEKSKLSSSTSFSALFRKKTAEIIKNFEESRQAKNEKATEEQLKKEEEKKNLAYEREKIKIEQEEKKKAIAEAKEAEKQKALEEKIKIKEEKAKALLEKKKAEEEERLKLVERKKQEALAEAKARQKEIEEKLAQKEAAKQRKIQEELERAKIREQIIKEKELEKIKHEEEKARLQKELLLKKEELRQEKIRLEKEKAEEKKRLAEELAKKEKIAKEQKLKEEKRREEKRKKLIEEARQRKIEEQKKKTQLRIERVKERKKQWKKFLQNCEIFKNKTKLAIYIGFQKTIAGIILVIFTFLGLYLIQIFLVTKIGLDNFILRQSAKIFPVPAIYSDAGFIEYYQYKDQKTKLYLLENATQAEIEKNLKIDFAKEIIISRLAKKYQIKISDQTLRWFEIMEKAATDSEINQVPMNRISRIASLLAKGEEFSEAAKLGDTQGVLTIKNNALVFYNFGQEIKLLKLQEISSVISTPEGYYMFKKLSENYQEANYAFLFIPANDLSAYIEKQIGQLKMWSLVD